MTRGGDRDIVALGEQGSFEVLSDRGIVLDDEDPVGHRRRAYDRVPALRDGRRSRVPEFAVR